MVDFPTYIRLVGERLDKKPQVRQSQESVGANPLRADDAADGEASRAAADKVLVLMPRVQAMQKTDESPTSEEAEQALVQLQQDLPNAGQTIGHIHEFADRRRIIALLTPLVED